MDETRIISPAYRQKSKLFLWPLLGIDRQSGFRPIKTFMADDHRGLTVKDRCLIAPFFKDQSKNYGDFEEEVLLSNEFFKDFYETEENLVYIFDFNKSKTLGEDYDKVVQGKYTELSYGAKLLINRFFASKDLKGRVRPHFQVAAYLNPSESDYFRVADQLDIDVYELMKGKEILDPPNILKETFDESEIKEK